MQNAPLVPVATQEGLASDAAPVKSPSPSDAPSVQPDPSPESQQTPAEKGTATRKRNVANAKRTEKREEKKEAAARKRGEGDALPDRLRELQDHNSGLMGENVRQSHELGRLRKLDKKNDELEDENKALRAEVAEQGREIKRLTAEVVSAKKNLADAEELAEHGRNIAAGLKALS